MKLSVVAILSVLGAASAFAPATPSVKSSVALNAEAEQSRKAFIGAAAAALFIPAAANAGTMAQENVNDPTERWESGKPTAAAEKLRVGRYTNARTQMNSNFAPQKRLTLERKSPVERLDINAPNFEAYKTTFPGLYKKL